jgi:hypothetical protein
MARKLHYGVIALALIGSTTLAIAQQNKSPQNAADEALTRTAPEAKDAPQAPPQMSIGPDASQPGLDAAGPVLVNGSLAVPGALQDTQTAPAKFSAKNNEIDKMPIMAYPPPLTVEQRQAIYQQVSQGEAPVVSLRTELQPAQLLPSSIELQSLPADMVEKYPSIADYKYIRLEDRILLVNPREGIVVGEIKE